MGKINVGKAKHITSYMVSLFATLMFASTLVFASEVSSEERQIDLFTEFVERLNEESDAQSRSIFARGHDSPRIGMFTTTDPETGEGNFFIAFMGVENRGKFDHIIEDIVNYAGIERDRLDIWYIEFNEWTLESFSERGARDRNGENENVPESRDNRSWPRREASENAFFSYDEANYNVADEELDESDVTSFGLIDPRMATTRIGSAITILSPSGVIVFEGT